MKPAYSMGVEDDPDQKLATAGLWIDVFRGASDPVERARALVAIADYVGAAIVLFDDLPGTFVVGAGAVD